MCQLHCWWAKGTRCSQKADLPEGFSVTQPLSEGNIFWWRLFLFIPYFFIWSCSLQVKVDEGKTIYFRREFLQQWSHQKQVIRFIDNLLFIIQFCHFCAQVWRWARHYTSKYTHSIQGNSRWGRHRKMWAGKIWYFFHCGYYRIHCKRSALSFAGHGLGYDLRIELFPDWQLLCIWLVLSLINADLMTSFTTAVTETILAFWREMTSTEFSLCFLCIIQQYDEWWMQ